MSDMRLRVGQLAARLGVSTHALRAWEQRYGLFQPERSSGGYRLYGDADVRRGQSMCDRIAAGAPAVEAARQVLRQLPHAVAGEVREPRKQQWRAALLRGCVELDEPSMRSVLAESSTLLGTDDYVRDIVVPLLRAVAVPHDDGGPLMILHAHFVGELVRDALLARRRSSLPDDAPRLWLACPEKELHDLGLLAFGLVAAEDGWAVRFFGANTPLASLARLAGRDPPAAVVVSVTRPAPLRAAALDVTSLAAAAPTAVGGPAARRAATLGLPVSILAGDIVPEAHGLAATLGHRVRRPAEC